MTSLFDQSCTLQQVSVVACIQWCRSLQPDPRVVAKFSKHGSLELQSGSGMTRVSLQTQNKPVLIAKLDRCCPRITRSAFAWLTAHVGLDRILEQPSLMCGAVTSVMVKSNLCKADCAAWNAQSLPDGNQQVRIQPNTPGDGFVTYYNILLLFMLRYFKNVGCLHPRTQGMHVQY